MRRGTPTTAATGRGRVPTFSPPAVTPAAGGVRGELVDELLDDWPDPDSLEGSTRRRAGAGRSLAGMLWLGWGLAILLGVFNLITPAPRVTPTATASPTAATASPAPPGGCAELAVAAWLAGNTDALRTLMIGDLPRVDAAARAAARTYTVDAQQGAVGAWTYTVAADVVNLDRAGKATPAGTQFFAVTLVRDPAGGGCAGWTVVTLPAQVAGPTRPGDIRTGYGQQLPNAGTPLADTLSRFFTALLTGGAVEDLARYTSPGSTIRPIVPAPYTAIRIDGLYATGDAKVGAGGGVGAVPADGTRIRVLARVGVRTADGQEWLLSYPLSVAVRGGRWEVTAIDQAPALAASATPSPGPSAGTGPPSSSAPAAPSTTPSGSPS